MARHGHFIAQMSVNMAPSPAPIKPVYSFPSFAYLASATAVKAAMAVAAKTMLAPPISLKIMHQVGKAPCKIPSIGL